MVAQANRLAGSAAELTADDLMQITVEDVKAARASDEKILAAERKEKEIIESAEATIAELEQLARSLPVSQPEVMEYTDSCEKEGTN